MAVHSILTWKITITVLDTLKKTSPCSPGPFVGGVGDRQ